MSASAAKTTGSFGCCPQVAETQIESKLLKKRALHWKVMDSDENRDISGPPVLKLKMLPNWLRSQPAELKTESVWTGTSCWCCPFLPLYKNRCGKELCNNLTLTLLWAARQRVKVKKKKRKQHNHHPITYCEVLTRNLRLFPSLK